MDNNPTAPAAPTPPVPPITPPPASGPAPTPLASTSLPPLPPTVTQAGGSGSKKMMIIIIIVLILAILGAGGFYYYQMMNQESSPAENSTTTTSTDNKALDQLNNEAQDIKVADPDAGLSSVNQEINSLDATASASPVSSASSSALLNNR